jgi:peptide/nickel transport system ATP-binding protein
MLIDIDNLSVCFGDQRAVDGVSLAMDAGERLAIVGESGSGKSTLARALIGLVAKPGIVTAQRFVIDGHDMRTTDWRKVRGHTIGLMLQDPRYSLHPTMGIASQIAEVTKRPAADCLAEVGLSPDIAKRYPHQLSGGQGQRAYLAMTLAQAPRLLIADEPTSALDPPLALQMMALLDERMQAHGMGLLLITHDIDLAMRSCPRLLVMQEGRVIEELRDGKTPTHSFTKRLLQSVPRLAC